MIRPGAGSVRPGIHSGVSEFRYAAPVTYDEAMATLRGPGSSGRRVTRPGLPGEGVTWRFGHAVVVTGPHSHISYTPTREDLAALDWVPVVSGVSAPEESQAVRTARVVVLLDEAWMARQAGQADASDAAVKAAIELDPLAVSGVRGGMLIGQLPDPQRDPDGWAEFVESMRERLSG